MNLADEILIVIRQKAGLTEGQIATLVFGRRGYQQRINSICRRLVHEGKVQREGNGGAADPFIYRLPSTLDHSAVVVGL